MSALDVGVSLVVVFLLGLLVTRFVFAVLLWRTRRQTADVEARLRAAREAEGLGNWWLMFEPAGPKGRYLQLGYAENCTASEAGELCEQALSQYIWRTQQALIGRLFVLPETVAKETFVDPPANEVRPS